MPELTDIDVFSRDYPKKMKVLDLDLRKGIQKGNRAQLIFPTYNKRGWVRFLGIMDGGLIGEMLEPMGEGLVTGDRVFFEYRHIWDLNQY